MKFPKPPKKPVDLNQRQEWFERRQRAVEMRREGATFEEIGQAFGVSSTQARVLVLTQEHSSLRGSPVQKWEATWAAYKAKSKAWADTQRAQLDRFISYLDQP